MGMQISGRWVKGDQSPYPNGRPKNGTLTAKGILERFFMQIIKPTRLKKLYGMLTPREQAEFIKELMQYFISKSPTITIEALPEGVLDELYDKVIYQLEQKQNILSNGSNEAGEG